MQGLSADQVKQLFDARERAERDIMDGLADTAALVARARGLDARQGRGAYRFAGATLPSGRSVRLSWTRFTGSGSHTVSEEITLRLLDEPDRLFLSMRGMYEYLCRGCGTRQRSPQTCCHGKGGMLACWFSPRDTAEQVAWIAAWLIENDQASDLARDFAHLADEQMAELDVVAVEVALALGDHASRERALTALSLVGAAPRPVPSRPSRAR